VVGCAGGALVCGSVPVVRGGTELLYMEDFDEARKKGRIVCGEVDARGRVSAVQPVLERSYHLAYPCIFEHGARSS